jgi:hypothetical protein
MADESPDYLFVNGERVSRQTLEAAQGVSGTVGEGTLSRRFLRDLWRIMRFSPRLTLLVMIGIPLAALSASWSFLDTDFPKLNEITDSRVTDNDDVSFQSYKLNQAVDAYQKSVAVCDAKDTSIERCRDVLIAAKPSLDEIAKQADKLYEGFSTEETQRAMPSQCKAAGEALFQGYRRYVWIESQTIERYRNIDPKSHESLPNVLGALGKEKDPVLQVINTPWPKECSDY